ncbi:MAG: hypothetical protein ACK549_13410, partial [Cyanobacteriota bacterium]
RDVGEPRARVLMLTSHQASGGCPSFAGVGRFFSELLEEGQQRLLRGGSWGSYPRNCRSAGRDRSRPVGADGTVGFRVVCLPQGPSLNA